MCILWGKGEQVSKALIPIPTLYKDPEGNTYVCRCVRPLLTDVFDYDNPEPKDGT